MFAKRGKNQDIFYMMGQEKIIGHFCTYMYVSTWAKRNSK